MRQEETAKILEPFVTYVTNMWKWHCEKTHGSQFMEGFPDLYMMHGEFSPKWVECKVIRGGDIHFTPAQMHKFPLWIAHGIPIWLVAGEDFRGVTGSPGRLALERSYRSLFDPPNLVHYLNPESRRSLLR